MKHFYWWLLMIVLGAAGLIVIVMFESITLNNDTEYYVLKEAMEAAMLESVDVVCYNITKKAVPTGCDGQLKISEQKFVENFTRRFASVIAGDIDEYEILFYDIIETPPKASIVISSSNKNFNLVSDSIDIKNGLTGILEAGYTQVSVDDAVYQVEIPSISDISVTDDGFEEAGDNLYDDTSECPMDADGKYAEWCADPDDDAEGAEGEGVYGDCEENDCG